MEGQAFGLGVVFQIARMRLDVFKLLLHVADEFVVMRRVVVLQLENPAR